MAVGLLLKIVFWGAVILIGTGFLSYHKYAIGRKISFGIPRYTYGGFLDIGPRFSTTRWILFRLLLTLLAIGALRMTVSLLSYIFELLLF